MKIDMAVASASTIETEHHASFLSDIRNWLADIVADRRTAAASRALRRELADMDETLLRDIGITDGEIWHIRQVREASLRAL
ncbi:MAG: DUF1127 domain-containing protein [Hyphomicrobiales bacterium]|nr:DUF1127 domain-containing protein [Hyphomicrobiales bacterium]